MSFLVWEEGLGSRTNDESDQVAREGPTEVPRPHDPPEVQVGDKECTEDETAAEQSKCDAAFADGMKRYRKLKQERDSLNRAVYLHNLDVSAYEGDLRRFSNVLAGFLNALSVYLEAIQGRTYATTAINDFADQLEKERGPLEKQRILVESIF